MKPGHDVTINITILQHTNNKVVTVITKAGATIAENAKTNSWYIKHEL